MRPLVRNSIFVMSLALFHPAAAFADDPIGAGTTAAPGQPIPAQAQLIDRLKPQDIVDILQRNGYRASIETNNNQTMISTGMSGYSVDILVYDCKPDGCGSIQFVMSGKSQGIDVKFANNWNDNWRYTKMSIGDDGVFYFTMDVNLSGGVTLSNILAAIDIFDSALGRLKQ